MTSQLAPRSFRRAFTLVELLVVVGIIALLLGLLAASLSAARRHAYAIKCATNLRQIGAAMRLYADDHNDVLFQPTDRATWITVWQPPGEASSALRLINPYDANAYWGVEYLPYLASPTLVAAKGDDARQIVEFARKFWLCPSSGGVDNAFGNTDPTNPVSYGINFRVTGAATPRYRKLATYKAPATIILVQDSVETRLESKQGDSLSDYGTGMNLTDWRPPNGAMFLNGNHPDPLREYFRHNRRCNVLWMDWHVSSIAESNGSDVPSLWYEGNNYNSPN